MIRVELQVRHREDARKTSVSLTLAIILHLERRVSQRGDELGTMQHFTVPRIIIPRRLFRAVRRMSPSAPSVSDDRVFFAHHRSHSSVTAADTSADFVRRPESDILVVLQTLALQTLVSLVLSLLRLLRCRHILLTSNFPEVGRNSAMRKQRKSDRSEQQDGVGQQKRPADAHDFLTWEPTDASAFYADNMAQRDGAAETAPRSSCGSQSLPGPLGLMGTPSVIVSYHGSARALVPRAPSTGKREHCYLLSTLRDMLPHATTYFSAEDHFIDVFVESEESAAIASAIIIEYEAAGPPADDGTLVTLTLENDKMADDTADAVRDGPAKSACGAKHEFDALQEARCRMPRAVVEFWHGGELTSSPRDVLWLCVSDAELVAAQQIVIHVEHLTSVLIEVDACERARLHFPLAGTSAVMSKFGEDAMATASAPPRPVLVRHRVVARDLPPGQERKELVGTYPHVTVAPSVVHDWNERTLGAYVAERRDGAALWGVSAGHDLAMHPIEMWLATAESARMRRSDSRDDSVRRGLHVEECRFMNPVSQSHDSHFFRCFVDSGMPWDPAARKAMQVKNAVADVGLFKITRDVAQPEMVPLPVTGAASGTHYLSDAGIALPALPAWADLHMDVHFVGCTHAEPRMLRVCGFAERSYDGMLETVYLARSLDSSPPNGGDSGAPVYSADGSLIGFIMGCCTRKNIRIRYYEIVPAHYALSQARRLLGDASDAGDTFVKPSLDGDATAATVESGGAASSGSAVHAAAAAGAFSADAGSV